MDECHDPQQETVETVHGTVDQTVDVPSPLATPVSRVMKDVDAGVAGEIDEMDRDRIVWSSLVRVLFLSSGMRSWRWCKPVLLNAYNNGSTSVRRMCQFLKLWKRSLAWCGWSHRNGVQRVAEQMAGVGRLKPFLFTFVFVSVPIATLAISSVPFVVLWF